MTPASNALNSLSDRVSACGCDAAAGVQVIIASGFSDRAGTGDRAYCQAIVRKRYCHRSCARSEAYTSELQSLMRTSHAVFCLTKKHYSSPLNTITKQVL